ncbi:hypothetical protein GPA00_04245 [Streptococcus equinus]|uniref:enhanced serine sensitivity protein SseB C-terminal domain-containing protein n=1 Tax=Streptococcus equinus TaxID=1335 RepID=UPI0012FCB66C|nr:enhanced serine sensitivity protein SseB C-terminal domain-containing protein [Streptococcus equinus]QGX46328.1 hypothetical protein GPA00_04245 [Streptococcus equinus]
MIQNTELLNLINKLRNLYNKNTESELYTKLQLSTFLCPLSVFIDNNRIKIDMITEKKGNSYFSLYTDYDSFKIDYPNSNYTELNIQTAIDIINNQKNISGIVINPNSTNFILSRENINYINTLRFEMTIPKNENIEISLPKNYSKILTQKFIDFFKNFPTIEKAYLLKIKIKDEEKLLLVVEAPDFQDIISKLYLDINQILSNDTIYFVDSNNKTISEIIKNCPILYKKSENVIETVETNSIIDSTIITDNCLELLIDANNLNDLDVNQNYDIKLKTKINNYIHFIKTKGICNKFERIIININFKKNPSNEILALLVDTQKNLFNSTISLKVTLPN